MSAYDNLQKKFGKDLVHFYNPCRGGKHTEQQGYKEITAEIDEATKTIVRTNTAEARCQALIKLYLLNNRPVWIKTATVYGRGRFWTEPKRPFNAYDPDDENDPEAL